MNKKKPNALRVRFDNDMYDTIERIAQENNATMSEVVRYLISKGLKADEIV